MFSKKHRLSKTKDVQAVFAGGRAFFNPYFNLKILKTAQAQARFTVVVSTKVSKKAVVRNRFKRVIREFLKKNLRFIFPADYVIIVKPALIKLGKNEGLESLKNLLFKAKAL